MSLKSKFNLKSKRGININIAWKVHFIKGMDPLIKSSNYLWKHSVCWLIIAIIYLFNNLDISLLTIDVKSMTNKVNPSIPFYESN